MAHPSNHKIYTDPREAALVKAADKLLCWPRHPRMNGIESTACPGWGWHIDENNELCLVRFNDCSLKITERDWRNYRESIQHVMETHRSRSSDLNLDQAKRLLATVIKAWPNKGEELPALPPRMEGWAWGWCGEVMVLKHKWNGMIAIGDYWQARKESGLADPLSRFHQAASNADDDYHKLATTLLQAFEQMAMGGEAQPTT